MSDPTLLAFFDYDTDEKLSLHLCRDYIEKTKFKIENLDNVTQNDDFFGVYIISLLGGPEIWLRGGIEKNFLFNIPKKVLELARKKKIVIVVDNQTEANSFLEKQDDFRLYHFLMDFLDLPANSLLFINGDHNFEKTYNKWCVENNQTQKLAHITALSWPICLKGRYPDKPLILTSILNNQSTNFNSLNRTNRIHRKEHIRFLRDEKLLDKGLVSFNFVMDKLPPMFVDGDWSINNPDDDNTSIFNHNIFKNSLLTFVTETMFFENSLFLTEKVFKPIAAGHPFLLLGPAGSLAKLKELGYHVDFTMFPDYDSIEDNYLRFAVVHDELKKWIELPRDQKIKFVHENIDKIKHNQNLVKEENYNDKIAFRLYEKILELRNHVN